MSEASQLAGDLLVVGFTGSTLPGELARTLRDGEAAGVILFRRNIEDPAQVAALLRAVLEASPRGRPAVRAVDQEGGRVRRLRAPCLELPPAAVLARAGAAFCAEVGEAVARELAALGFSLNFAPVLDVHSNEANPIIGDRAFGSTPAAVIEIALAFARGQALGGVDTCGKHFPGHGDTDKDSHLELPVVSRPAASLREIELPPFAAARSLPSMMSAHVRYPALDAEHVATLSPRIATQLLRDELGYRGVLFSDDLEMKALAGAPADHAVAAIAAGCDMLLVCSDRAAADACFQALRQEIERSDTFRARAREAGARAARLRARVNMPDLSRFHQLTQAHAGLQRRVNELLP